MNLIRYPRSGSTLVTLINCNTAYPMNNQIKWFEIPVNNLNRAKQFYNSILSCNFQEIDSDDAKMAVFQGNMDRYGATGCLVEYNDVRPSVNGTVIYFSCEDVDRTLTLIEKSGGKVLIPKTDIGEYGYFAHFIDSEGNRVALHSIR